MVGTPFALAATWQQQLLSSKAGSSNKEERSETGSLPGSFLQVMDLILLN
jgi:hypothetical protein